jgi:hypothetical protein
MVALEELRSRADRAVEEATALRATLRDIVQSRGGGGEEPPNWNRPLPCLRSALSCHRVAYPLAGLGSLYLRLYRGPSWRGSERLLQLISFRGLRLFAKRAPMLGGFQEQCATHVGCRLIGLFLALCGVLEPLKGRPHSPLRLGLSGARDILSFDAAVSLPLAPQSSLPAMQKATFPQEPGHNEARVSSTALWTTSCCEAPKRAAAARALGLTFAPLSNGLPACRSDAAIR